MRAGLAALALLIPLAGCGEAPAEPAWHAGADPERLSGWGQVRAEGGRLIVADGVTAYALNTALFSDYAQKLRTVWLPEGAKPASYDPDAVFDFPVGTVITKTFYYPYEDQTVLARPDTGWGFDGRALDLDTVRLIETRVLVHREDGWAALPYRWNDGQTEATLLRAGGFEELTLARMDGRREQIGYLIPGASQCASCHETDVAEGGLAPIGPSARQLNRDWDRVHGGENQLDAWVSLGLLDAVPRSPPAAARWSGEAVPMGAALDAAARSYLEINCAHCHSSGGPAASSGLRLAESEPAGPSLGLCKPPIAAGRGTGGRRFSIQPGEPEASIFIHRMESVRPDVMMPELGRSAVHDEGVALVAAWIDRMAGGCGAGPP